MACVIAFTLLFSALSAPAGCATPNNDGSCGADSSVLLQSKVALKDKMKVKTNYIVKDNMKVKEHMKVKTEQGGRRRRRRKADSCDYANDGVCDEPDYCSYGTDTTDCEAGSGTQADTGTQADSCQYANDGVCDEPDYCHVGTDTTDCKATTGASSEGLSQTQKDALVEKHNSLRADMGASDMMKMVWDETLADAAQEYISSCPSGHSQNRPSGVGENIAGKWSSYFSMTAATDFTPSVQSWYDEIKDAGKYKKGGTFEGFGKCKGVCGHYTQVVWAAANRLGCGVASCPHHTGMPGYKLVCQYGSSVPGENGGNMVRDNLFTRGSACSSCPSGFETCSQGLCS